MISASGPADGTRSWVTNISVGVSPQRRNTVLPFATFCSGIVTVFLCIFHFSCTQRSLLRSSDCCDLIRMFLRAFRCATIYVINGENARHNLSLRKSHVIRQEVLQLFYVIEHHLIRKCGARQSRLADADSSLPRASVTAGTCFP